MPKITPVLIPGSPLMLVGEAPGKSEEMVGKPFVGTSGQELDRMLADAGLDRNSCSLSNVFLERPENNDLTKWMVNSKSGGVGTPIAKGKYFKEKEYAERERLYREIESVRPNLIIAFGNTACWALLDKTGISYLRGTVSKSPYVSAKVLPTYHPAAILRQWEFRATTVTDLIKARRESAYPELRFPSLKAIIEPTLDDCRAAVLRLRSGGTISYDIETAVGQITCIGFAVKGFAITIPFVSYRRPDFSYWPEQEEILAWGIVREILNLPNEKVTQNGLYDIQYLMKYNIRPRNSIHDTMLLHHSMMPEMPKSLAFLGSVYTNYPSWKQMRPRGEIYLNNKKEE